jgi:hypothetical protein
LCQLWSWSHDLREMIRNRTIRVSGGLSGILGCSGAVILGLLRIVGAALIGETASFLCMTVEDESPGAGAGVTSLYRRGAKRGLGDDPQRATFH